MSVPASIEAAVVQVPSGIDAICNMAGLMIDKLNDGASIVNAAFLAGLGWPQAVEQVKNFIALHDFNGVETLCEQSNVEEAGFLWLNSLFFTT